MIKNIKYTIIILFSYLIIATINENIVYSKQNLVTPIEACSNQTFNVELLSWEDVKNIIPMYSKFEVIDIATGKSFNVQRRAGRYHADVQPLTVDDTKIMKEIYNGSWSWDRKAVIIQVNGRLIAASMHGMPHGAGAIQNNFPGHFCIHFYGSKTHIAKEMDLAHQLMVLKAAGQVESYLRNSSAQQLVDIFLVAIDQRDKEILELIFSSEMSMEQIDEEIQAIEDIKRISSFEKDSPILITEEIIDVTIYSKMEGRKKETIFIELRKEDLFAPWKISAVAFDKEEG